MTRRMTFQWFRLQYKPMVSAIYAHPHFQETYDAWGRLVFYIEDISPELS